MLFRSRVYTYYFDQFRAEPLFPDGPVAKGAAHASDMAYVFGHLDLNPAVQATEEEKALSDLMIRYWTNFAKSGDPNGEGLPEWPLFSEGEETVLWFRGAEPVTIAVPNLEKLEFMDEYFRWLRQK